MRVQRHDDPARFLDQATAFLLRAEAENNMFLGLARPAESKPRAWSEDDYLATVEDAGRVVACALCTPPFGVNITRADATAIEPLADDLHAKYRALSWVYGPEPTVGVFADHWSLRTGATARPRMRERLFEARAVNRMAMRPPGELRLAVQDDVATVADWAEAFDREAGVGRPIDVRRDAEGQITRQQVFVWCDGGPVSVAGFVGRGTRGASIAWVYTPPQLRAHGYASACVSDLTQRLLDQGRAFCWISTDLTNATTNKIYPAIGYRPVCDRSRIDFDVV
jgi:predicted GNAT family acetyltransferase